jgi:NitT/TauT family transport system permease protein
VAPRHGNIPGDRQLTRLPGRRWLAILPGAARLVAAPFCADGSCRLGIVLPREPGFPAAAAAAVVVWSVLSENWGILFKQSVPTTLETITSFAVATLLGFALAVAITFSAWVREALYPNIVMFQLIPKIALAPLFIVRLGVGSRSCTVIAIFIAFFPVVISTATGLVSAKPEVIQLCRSLTASEMQMFRLARFPYAMPFVFAGMKMAMIGVIVGEFITAQAGPGYIIMFASSAGETATVLAGVVLLCGIGLALFSLVVLGEIAVQHWYGGEIPVGGVI